MISLRWQTAIRPASNFGLFPHDPLGTIERACHKFGFMGPFQYDMKRIDGTLTAQGAPTFPFVAADHVRRAIADMQNEGVRFANIDTLHVRENGIDVMEILIARARNQLGEAPARTETLSPRVSQT